MKNITGFLKIFLFTVTLLALSSAYAFNKDNVERFNKKGTLYVLRDANGKFISYARVQIEKWHLHGQVFVVRDKLGMFMTWGFGEFECWDSGEFLSARLVLRDKQGKFIAHTDADPKMCD